MTISILVEPSPMGFCATTGGPLDLSAEAASASEAVNALHEKISRRLGHGAILIDHPVQAPRPPIPVLSLAENPLFDAWLAAVESYRAEREKLEGSGAYEANESWRFSFLSAKLIVRHNDLRIAAIAKELKATVVTRNRRDFGRVPGLMIEDWSI